MVRLISCLHSRGEQCTCRTCTLNPACPKLATHDTILTLFSVQLRDHKGKRPKLHSSDENLQRQHLNCSPRPTTYRKGPALQLPLNTEALGQKENRCSWRSAAGSWAPEPAAAHTPQAAHATPALVCYTATALGLRVFTLHHLQTPVRVGRDIQHFIIKQAVPDNFTNRGCRCSKHI